MAVDKVEIEYHLTPDGWVRGAFRSIFPGDNEEGSIPPNRLLTVVHETYQGSRFSPEERSVRVIWKADTPDLEIAALRQKFPPPYDPKDE